MSEDYECRRCYGKTLKIIRDYLESQCREGESLEAEVYGSYSNEPYLSIDYATIIGKKHIEKYEHLPIAFLSEKFMAPVIPIIIDSLLKRWREQKREAAHG